MVLPGIVLVVIAISLSAMTYWAVTFHSNGVRHTTVGLVQKLLGAAGILMSAIVFSMSRSSENTPHTFDRRFLDLDGGFRSIHRGTSRLTQRVLSSVTAHPPRQILPAWGMSSRRHTVATERDY